MADISVIQLYGTNYNIKDATARNTANSANTTAGQALTAANSAVETAETASNTASNALTNANQAQQTANNAQSSAITANTNANKALDNLLSISASGETLVIKDFTES